MHLYATHSHGTRALAISALIFVVALTLMINLLFLIGENAGEKQLETLENTLRRACVTCFAVEGRYPPDLPYLMENYGVSYDEARYFIRYEAFSDNIMPDLAVLVRGDV